MFGAAKLCLWLLPVLTGLVNTGDSRPDAKLHLTAAISWPPLPQNSICCMHSSEAWVILDFWRRSRDGHSKSISFCFAYLPKIGSFRSVNCSSGFAVGAICIFWLSNSSIFLHLCSIYASFCCQRASSRLIRVKRPSLSTFTHCMYCKNLWVSTPSLLGYVSRFDLTSDWKASTLAHKQASHLTRLLFTWSNYCNFNLISLHALSYRALSSVNLVDWGAVCYSATAIRFFFTNVVKKICWFE